MKTDESTQSLIDALARGLEPVPRLPSAGKRAAAWSVGAAMYVLLLVAMMAWFAGSTANWFKPFWVSQLIAVATSVLASAAAFASVIPGSPNRWRVWAALAAPVWLITLIGASPADVDWGAATAAPHEWVCIGLILIGGAPLMIVLARMLRRGAPLSPATTAGFAALAAASLMNVAACAALPHSVGAVTFVWHGSVVAAVTVLAALCGHLLFKWSAEGPRQADAIPGKGS